MPRLPQGLSRRKVRTQSGVTNVWTWRRTIEGKDHRVSLGSDYAVAMAEYRRLELEGPPKPEPVEAVTPPPLTVEAFTRRWLAEYAASKRIPRGRAQAEQRMRDYLWPIVGAIPLADLKPADIRALNAELESRKVGLTTRRRMMEDLRCSLNYAVNEAEVLPQSPWRKGMLPKQPETEPKPLTELALAEAVRVAPEKWKPVLLLKARTGLRWGELRALRWDGVREAPYPHLIVARSHDGPTKSGKVREVALLPEAQDVLDSLPRGTGRVFPWLPETASWIRRYIIQHSWVKDFCVKRCRSTFGTRFIERGGSVETLQVLLGHASVTTTQKHYARLRPEVVAAEVRKIGRDGTVDGTVEDSKRMEARK